jgi:prepilin peptidase CpaA
VEHRHPGSLATAKSRGRLITLTLPLSTPFPLVYQLALLVAALASVADLRTRRIPNLLTFGATLCAIVLQTSTDGTRGLGLSLAGWLVGVAIFFPVFALGGMGAGDVKLVGALGACLGPIGALHVAAGAAIAGGLLAVVLTLRTGYFATAVANVRRLFGFWRTNGLTPMPDLTLSSGSGPRLAYAVPILIGTVGALWFR